MGDVEGIAPERGIRRAASEQPRAIALFAEGEIGIPHRPGIDRARREGRGGVGGREVARFDRIEAEPRELQRLNGEVVRARSLGERDTLALQIGEAGEL
ncbi:hypothetical protein FJM51_21615 [Amaricoccus solimangrovi]|uniref:Uncharacterized protein n=1 Tax=Amaricoccus solimangrovi TaxID=2589815 RepID=A0A501W9K3_9RHOB|nr:hypothetical protein [Amaricoccus solimangrovi]TPE46633.1 hypothetical protein FJM51_21615 [Amaricoccus solimangrovi]